MDKKIDGWMYKQVVRQRQIDRQMETDGPTDKQKEIYRKVYDNLETTLTIIHYTMIIPPSTH